MLRQKIFEEIKRQKIASNGRWLPNQYNVFYSDLDYTQKQNFAEAMSKLCEKGFFRREYDYYVLTEKGTEIIYS